MWISNNKFILRSPKNKSLLRGKEVDWVNVNNNFFGSYYIHTCIDITLNQIGNVFYTSTLFGNIDTLPAVPVIDTIICGC